MKFKNPFKKKRDWVKDFPGVRIAHAFTCGGVDYYEFEDPNMLTQGRGFAAANVLKELSMSCTRDFLLAHCEVMDSFMRPTKGGIALPDMVRHNLQLKERLEMIIDSITPYKTASVIYFDKTEDPYSYDYKYAMEVKIPKWKKEDVESFFLQTPVKNLIPSTLWSEETLASYMKVAQEVDKKHYKDILDTITQLSSNEPKMIDLLKRLKLEKNLI